MKNKKRLFDGLFSRISFFTIAIAIVLFGMIGIFQIENTLAYDEDICLGVSVDTGGVVESECRALVGIYNSANGDSWASSTNRGNTGDVCSWAGVGCASDTVTSLTLSNNALEGSVDLSGLPNILTLDLSKNLGLVGVSGLGSLSNLTSLDLTNIGSSTYPDGLSSLFNLQTLSLQSNGYDSFPAIGGLTNLVSINLAGNSIDDSSFDLSNLSLLNFLNISQNDFITAPTIANSNITILNISSNTSMTDISNLSSLSTLTTLNASYCAIDNDGLGSFTSLSLDGGSVVENCLTIYETAGDPLYVYLHDNSVDYVSQASCGTIYDSSDPVCGIDYYSPSTRTNGTVRAYVECDKPVDGATSYTFYSNGTHPFSFSNTIYDWNGTVNATVSWIEDTDPDCDTVSTQTAIDERVSGSFKCRDIDGGDGVSGIDGYSAGTTERTITFNIAVSDNSTKYKEVCDNAGNCIDVAIPVEGFVLSNPSCTVIKSPSTRTNGDVDVSLSCDGLEPLVGDDWTDTFSQNDSFSTIVRDAEGDPTTVSATISNIDKVAPTCNPTIQYSPADAGEWIAEDVTATLIGCTDTGGPGTPTTPSGINSSNSKTSIVFTDSGTGELYVVDNAGNRTTYEAEVTWVDKEGPSCPITYDIETPTNGNVVATLGDCGETVTIENNDQAVDYTFTDNGTFTYVVADVHGNTSEIVAEVRNIDRIAPICGMSYDPNTNTSAPVTSTLTGCSENVEITNNGGLSGHLFMTNSGFTYEFIDEAGNTGTKFAVVYWIDTSRPVCSISYDPDGPDKTGGDVVATLTGCSKDNITILNNGGLSGYTFTGDSEFVFLYKDELNNTGQTDATVTWIDKTSPTCEIIYDTKNRTANDVLATLVNCSEPIDITNNSGGHEYIFENTGDFTFYFKDGVGNTGSTLAEVTWIDKDIPVCEVVYSPEDAISGDVLVTLVNCSEPIDITNNNGEYEYIFENTGDFTFYFKDAVGNLGSTLAEVTWIDKVKPGGSISYSPDAATSGNVIATISLNETGTITNNSGSLSYIFTGNGDFLFEFEDLVGNTGELLAEVEWIDKKKPDCEIAYSTNKRTTSNVTATLINCSEDVDVTNNSGSISYKFTDDGNFTFNIIDSVGNTGSVDAKVTWISNGGGGGGSSTDYCPQGDLSPSYYDGICEVETEENTKSNSSSTSNICEVLDDTTYSDDSVSAFLRAYDLGITTMCPIESADLEGNLIRNHMAKMISVFSMKVLGMMPDMNKECNFADIAEETNEMKAYIQLSCQLGLMGYQSDGITVKENFDPKDVVDRGQFGTILSRLLRGNTYDNGDDELFYTNHIANLKDQKIMSNDYYSPTDPEIRGAMMIMMQKTQAYKILEEYYASK